MIRFNRSLNFVSSGTSVNRGVVFLCRARRQKRREETRILFPPLPLPLALVALSRRSEKDDRHLSASRKRKEKKCSGIDEEEENSPSSSLFLFLVLTLIVNVEDRRLTQNREEKALRQMLEVSPLHRRRRKNLVLSTSFRSLPSLDVLRPINDENNLSSNFS